MTQYPDLARPSYGHCSSRTKRRVWKKRLARHLRTGRIWMKRWRGRHRRAIELCHEWPR